MPHTIAPRSSVSAPAFVLLVEVLRYRGPRIGEARTTKA